MSEALRVRKSRRPGYTCPLCRVGILVGQQITSHPQIAGWVHTDCPGRACEHCGQRLPLDRIARGFGTHLMCEGEAE